jgi:hypothetical protein
VTCDSLANAQFYSGYVESAEVVRVVLLPKPARLEMQVDRLAHDNSFIGSLV